MPTDGTHLRTLPHLAAAFLRTPLELSAHTLHLAAPVTAVMVGVLHAGEALLLLRRGGEPGRCGFSRSPEYCAQG